MSLSPNVTRGFLAPVRLRWFIMDSLGFSVVMLGGQISEMVRGAAVYAL